MNTVPISFKVSQELKEQLDLIKNEREIDMSDLIRQAIYDSLHKNYGGIAWSIESATDFVNRDDIKTYQFGMYISASRFLAYELYKIRTGS